MCFLPFQWKEAALSLDVRLLYVCSRRVMFAGFLCVDMNSGQRCSGPGRRWRGAQGEHWGEGGAGLSNSM